MRSTLLSAACVAALLAGPALAQEAQTPTTEGADTTEGATTAQATTPTEGTDATDGTLTAEGADATDGTTAAGDTQIADDATATDGAAAEETELADDATAAEGAAADDTQTAEGADVQVTTTEGETETAATTEPAVEDTAQASTEEPAGAAVTTTEGETETADAAEQMPLPSDPQEALAMASSQLEEAMNQYGGSVSAGTDVATADGTQTIDREGQEQITQALDQFDLALDQYGQESGDEQVQEQIIQLQAQSQQAREQLEDDPQGAMQNIDQLTQAALTLPQSEIPAEADLIIDTQLVSSDGEQVGEISNVLVTADGQVSAILVSRGGALGLGGSEVAVPWDQIQIQGDQTVVGMTRDEMEQLPDYVTD